MGGNQSKTMIELSSINLNDRNESKRPNRDNMENNDQFSIHMKVLKLAIE